MKEIKRKYKIQMENGEQKKVKKDHETQKFIKDIKNSVNNDIFEQFLKKNNARFEAEDEASQDSSIEEDSQEENFNEEDFEALIQGAGESNQILMVLTNSLQKNYLK